MSLLPVKLLKASSISLTAVSERERVLGGKGYKLQSFILLLQMFYLDVLPY